jgi:hypothetical protein
MKNEYKKRDAKGNKLPEQIGKGLNLEHCNKVLKERENLSETVSFRVTKVDKENFLKQCKKNNLDPTLVNRELYKNFANNKI